MPQKNNQPDAYDESRHGYVRTPEEDRLEQINLDHLEGHHPYEGGFAECALCKALEPTE